MAFPVNGAVAFSSPFRYKIEVPLSPIDWYALIKYATAYIGSNMHPIVTALTNGVPCYSLDNWGSTDFWGHKKHDESSKVYDVLKQYGLEKNRTAIENGICDVTVSTITKSLSAYPVEIVEKISNQRYTVYSSMMQNIIKKIKAL